ncbi:T9SS type A sorting domain-containing protein [Flavobacterium sp.]|uniref:T9SS type A sorting domain-containing protein n=1 Tax=Flavobacterium sp. TaxID=239 RepID=UPI0035AE58EC
MNKVIKIVFCFVCLNSAVSFAQVDEYLALEKNRISNSYNTEKEIRRFIDENFNKYKLSTEITDEVIEHLRREEAFSDAELKFALKNAKIVELRKLYFKNNPEKRKDYIANAMPSSVAQQCVNGGFEDGLAGYSFWSDAHPQPQSGEDFFLSCATPTVQTASNVVVPAVNNFNSTITMIDNTAPGYQVYDPVLASFGVNVPTLDSSGGTRCIKLNNTGGFGSSDLSSASRVFPVVNEPTIDFNFSLIMDNKPAHGQPIQPYFRVRVYDQNNAIVDEICIIANPDNCLFNRINVASDRRILYTGWICARLNVQDIIGQPARIEFSVSDCQPSKHFGTVYIDNICGTICSTPQLGALSLDPEEINCPDVSSTTPIEVCGTFQPPVGAVLNTMQLNILQNGNIVGTISAPSTLTANTFCFSVLPSLFGASASGDYEFQVNATFNVDCPAGTFVYDISDTSASVGPDVTFNNCCQATLSLSSPSDDMNNLSSAAVAKRERSDWIKATNLIQVGDNSLNNGVVYHSGNYVELNPGFEALSGSQFAAYIEGCSGNYLYKMAVSQVENKYEPKIEEEKINLIKIGSGFKIVPNPSSSWIEVVMDEGQFRQLQITTIDGKLVQESNFEKTDKIQLDVSRFASGVYVINIVTEFGDIVSEKLMKN